ncbi:hypothetical protein F5148DRAFT_1197733, partial [Russula earlei]
MAVRTIRLIRPQTSLGPDSITKARSQAEAMDMSFPLRDGHDWGSALPEICPEDSASNTLVGGEPSPRDTDLAKSGSSEPTRSQSPTAVVVGSMKRKGTLVLFDGLEPPGRRRKTDAGHAKLCPRGARPSPSAISVRSDEKSSSPQSTQSSLEGSLVQAISGIEALTTTVAEQNRNIEKLVQDNAGLRDEVRSLSQTVKSSTRDVQRVEYIISKMIAEFKGKFEKTLDRSESHIRGPMDRILEELGRIRANPPMPASVPSVAAYPSNTPYAPEFAAGDPEWSSRDEYVLSEPNKPQENWEQHGPPNNKKYGRGGGSRPFRGRGRGFRGAQSGNNTQRPYPPPSFPEEGYGTPRVAATAHSAPTSTPLESAPPPVLTPGGSVPANTLRRGDAHHSQGHARTPSHPPAVQSPPAHHPHPLSSSYSHPHAADSQTSPALPSTPPPSSQQQQQ